MVPALARSLEGWCVYDVDTETIFDWWHALADSSSINRALEALDRHEPIDPAQLAACRVNVDTAMNAQLQQVEILAKAGKTEEASTPLKTIDQLYGGLAADCIVELADRRDASR
jgi:hypothetical protein